MKKYQIRLNELRTQKTTADTYIGLKKLVEEYDYLVDLLLTDKKKKTPIQEESTDLQYFDESFDRENELHWTDY